MVTACFLLVSCSGRNTGSSALSGFEVSEHIPLEHAEQFTADRLENGCTLVDISGEKYLFDVDIDNTTNRRRKDAEPFLFLSISDASDTIEYVRYAEGTWSWNQETENVRIAVDRLRMLAEANI